LVRPKFRLLVRLLARSACLVAAPAAEIALVQPASNRLAAVGIYNNLPAGGSLPAVEFLAAVWLLAEYMPAVAKNLAAALKRVVG